MDTACRYTFSTGFQMLAGAFGSLVAIVLYREGDSDLAGGGDHVDPSISSGKLPPTVQRAPWSASLFEPMHAIKSFQDRSNASAPSRWSSAARASRSIPAR